jgi:predicted DNA-binding protein (MmcQ/YjbR family)
MSTPLEDAEKALLHFALTLPEAFEDFPWGERNMKVGKKIFTSLGMVEYPKGAKPRLRLSLKLTDSHEEAMALPFTQASGYNLGKHGWVSMWFSDADDPPVPLLMEWIEESYRNIAPKRLVAQLDTPKRASEKGTRQRK